MDREKLPFYHSSAGSATLNLIVLLIAGVIVIGALGLVIAFAVNGLSHHALSLDLFGAPKDKVAVIYVEGQMVADKGVDDKGAASSADVVRCMRKATEDKTVKAIVLRVNSPGGSPAAAEEIIAQINKTRKSMPVVVSMGDMATSAAYYISTCTDRIVANPDTFTGSIGAVWVFKNKSRYYSDEGINVYVAKSGNFKDLGSDWRGLSDNEKKYVQYIINQSYMRFVNSVAGGRNKSVDAVLQIADGRVFTGSDAHDMGLVDQLGGLYDAVDLAADLAHMKGKPDIVYMNRQADSADSKASDKE